MHRPEPRRHMAMGALAMALLAACSSGGGDKASSSSTTTTTALGTMPPGPSLCTRMADAAVSKALGFSMARAGEGTSVSCVYTGGDEAHTGTVVSVTASDAGDDVGAMVSAAREASTEMTAIDHLGDAAYVMTVEGRPQGTLIVGGRQYGISLAGSLPRGNPKDALITLLRALAAGL